MDLMRHEKFTNNSIHLEAIAYVYSNAFNLCVLFEQTTKDGTPYGYVIGKDTKLDYDNMTADWSWGAYFTPIGFKAEDLKDRRNAAMLALMRLDYEHR